MELSSPPPQQLLLLPANNTSESNDTNLISEAIIITLYSQLHPTESSDNNKKITKEQTEFIRKQALKWFTKLVEDHYNGQSRNRHWYDSFVANMTLEQKINYVMTHSHELMQNMLKAAHINVLKIQLEFDNQNTMEFDAYADKSLKQEKESLEADKSGYNWMSTPNTTLKWNSTKNDVTTGRGWNMRKSKYKTSNTLEYHEHSRIPKKLKVPVEDSFKPKLKTSGTLQTNNSGSKTNNKEQSFFDKVKSQASKVKQSVSDKVDQTKDKIYSSIKKRRMRSSTVKGNNATVSLGFPEKENPIQSKETAPSLLNKLKGKTSALQKQAQELTKNIPSTQQLAEKANSALKGKIPVKDIQNQLNNVQQPLTNFLKGKLPTGVQDIINPLQGLTNGNGLSSVTNLASKLVKSGGPLTDENTKKNKEPSSSLKSKVETKLNEAKEKATKGFQHLKKKVKKPKTGDGFDNKQDESTDKKEKEEDPTDDLVNSLDQLLNSN
jgi:hypothetical protein